MFIMITKLLRSNFFPKMAAATLMPILAHLLDGLDFEEFLDPYRLVMTGLIGLADEIKKFADVNLPPITSVILIWTIIGFCAYLIYYSLCLIYYNIGNRLIMSMTFIENQPISPEINLTKLRRIGLHLTVAGYYLVSGISTYLLFSVSDSTRLWLYRVLDISIDYRLATILSFSVIIAIWFMTFSFFGTILQRILSWLIKFDVEDSHRTVDLRLRDILRPSRWQQIRFTSTNKLK